MADDGFLLFPVANCDCEVSVFRLAIELFDEDELAAGGVYCEDSMAPVKAIFVSPLIPIFEFSLPIFYFGNKFNSSFK